MRTISNLITISVYDSIQKFVWDSVSKIVYKSADEYTLDHTKGYVWDSNIHNRISRANVYDKAREFRDEINNS